MKPTFQIGDGVTEVLHCDLRPYTVIGVGKATLTLQADKCQLLNGPESEEADAIKQFMGGFWAHTTGEQRYSIEPDPNGPIFKAYWSEKRGYYQLHGRKIIAGRQRVYDFNF